MVIRKCVVNPYCTCTQELAGVSCGQFTESSLPVAREAEEIVHKIGILPLFFSQYYTKRHVIF